VPFCFFFFITIEPRVEWYNNLSLKYEPSSLGQAGGAWSAAYVSTGLVAYSVDVAYM